jgi:hypothetical protein
MRSLHLVRKSSPAVLPASVCLTASAFATNRLPPITVQAPVRKVVVGRSTIGVPIEESREACIKLDDLYPYEDRQAPTCISDAVAAASRQVNDAIARAQRLASAR